jgi:tRNA threonylcarbamoyl adenosine modification protein YeaZ
VSTYAAFVMKILAIDFSTARRSVALADSQDGNVRIIGRAEEQHGQATHAFALIDNLLREAGHERGAIECLTIGLGPGSYAGIRVSLALPQGWQLATGVKVVGISSIECLAETAREAGHRGPVTLVVDAQRGEFYLADYQLTDDGCEPMQPLAIVSRGEIERRLAEGITVFSPDAAATGMAGLRELYPDAARLAALAARCGEYVPAEVLEPIYLRATSFVKARKPDRVY